MPYWLTNPDHGTMPVYDTSEVERHKELGWTLLNAGESPDYSKKNESDHIAMIKSVINTEFPVPTQPAKRKPGRPRKAA